MSFGIGGNPRKELSMFFNVVLPILAGFAVAVFALFVPSIIKAPLLLYQIFNEVLGLFVFIMFLMETGMVETVALYTTSLVTSVLLIPELLKHRANKHQ